MDGTIGMRQRNLRRMDCYWGDAHTRHAALVPFFHNDYRVRGLVGYAVGEPPRWYPGVPVVVERRRLIFKTAEREHPPAWSELEREHFAGAFFHDPWGMLEAMLSVIPDTPPMLDAMNLAGRRLQGRPVHDVIFEPPLHRVRAFEVRSGFFGTRTISILSMPALIESLDVRPSRGAPPEGPETRARREGWLAGRVRKALAEAAGEEEELTPREL
jgi:hypothetical protein